MRLILGKTITRLSLLCLFLSGCSSNQLDDCFPAWFRPLYENRYGLRSSLDAVPEEATDEKQYGEVATVSQVIRFEGAYDERNELLKHSDEARLYWVFDYGYPTPPYLCIEDQSYIRVAVDYPLKSGSSSHYPTWIYGFTVNYANATDELTTLAEFPYDGGLLKSAPKEYSKQKTGTFSLPKPSPHEMRLSVAYRDVPVVSQEKYGKTWLARTQVVLDLHLSQIASRCNYEFDLVSPRITITYHAFSVDWQTPVNPPGPIYDTDTKVWNTKKKTLHGHSCLLLIKEKVDDSSYNGPYANR